MFPYLGDWNVYIKHLCLFSTLLFFHFPSSQFFIPLRPSLNFRTPFTKNYRRCVVLECQVSKLVFPHESYKRQANDAEPHSVLSLSMR